MDKTSALLTGLAAAPGGREGGAHERTIRDFKMENGAIPISQPLRDLRGVLTGVSVHEKDENNLREGNRP